MFDVAANIQYCVLVMYGNHLSKCYIYFLNMFEK